MSVSHPLPLLDSISIASPCPVSWADMPGDDRVRACSHCRQSVYDISAMTRTEAEDLLARATAGRVCARVYRRADGRVLTRDCPDGRMRAFRKRVAAGVGLVLAMLFVLTGFVAERLGGGRSGRTSWRDFLPVRVVLDWIDPTPTVTMGVMVCPTTPPPMVVTPPTVDRPPDEPEDE